MQETVGEESSGRENTSGHDAKQRKKKKVPVNKTFAEGNGKNITPNPALKKQGTTLRKNNYL